MAFEVPMENLFLSFLYSHLLATFLVSGIETSANYSESQVSVKVNNMPGQPSNPRISQLSGYITVNKNHGRSLFYLFFEAQENPSKKPLVLWLNGGPGCSSIGFGAAVELGPLRVEKDGLSINNHSWNKKANLLFVESPVGVGFSYTNRPSDLLHLDDIFVAEDCYSFLVNWLQRFPRYKTREFFMAGESYAGHYVPQLAELIFDRNKDKKKYPLINLKGFMVGNPATDGHYDHKGFLEYAWSHAVISDQFYQRAKRVCNFKTANWSDQCIDAMNKLLDQYHEIDIHNIYGPICLTNTTSNLPGALKVTNDGTRRTRVVRVRGGYDPCYSINTEKYFNRLDVQSSLHVKKERGTSHTAKWSVCNLAYLHQTHQGRPKDLDLQVAGRIVEYEGLTFVTVRGAGHLVPLNKPRQALAVFHSFLSGKPLPSQR